MQFSMMSSEKLRTSLLFTISTHPLQKREYLLRYRDMQVLTITFKSHFIIDFQLNTYFPSQFCVFTVKIPTDTQRSTLKRAKTLFAKLCAQIMDINLYGCGMGTLLVLVFHCFRENVVVTCKIGSFLCSLDNLLQKNVIVFFFGNQIQNGAFEKRVIFDLLFTFL